MGWVEDRIKQRELEEKRGGQNPTSQTGGTADSSGLGMVEQRMRERGLKPRTSNAPSAVKKDARPATAAPAVTPAVIGAKVAATVPMPKMETPKSMLETLGKPLIKPSAAEWAMEVMKRAEARLDENEFKAMTSGMTPMQGAGFRSMQGYQQQKQREKAARLNAYERGYAEAIANGDKETAQLFGYMLKQKEPDFRENSKYVSTKKGEPEYNYWTGMYNDTGYGDNEYEIINRNTDVENMVDAAEWELILNAAGEGDQELNNLTAEELGVYNYLYAMDKKNGTDDAKQFMKLMSGDLRARQRAEWEEQAKKFAEESPVGASVFNVLTSPRKTVSGVMQIADYLDDGEIDKNAGYNRAIYEGATRHATVSEMIDKNAGGVASFLYDAGMSAAENLYNMVLGGGKAGSLALMGTTSFSTGVSNAIDRGLSAEQALGLGAISAAAEIITENIGYGAIMDSIQKGGASAFKKSLIQNGLEEMSSATVNSIADTIIARDKSYWNMKVAEYKKQGMSEAEAFGMALLDTTLEIGKEGLAGVVSAGMMTGPSNVMQNYSQGKAFKDAEVPKEYLQGIITEGLTSEEGSSNRKLAEKLKKKLDVGQSISFYDYGKLYRENLANRGNAEIPDEEDFTKAGFTKTEFSGKVTNKQIRALDAIGKALGVNISIGAPSGSGKGAYNGFYDNGRIVIAQDAANPLEVVLAHEVTHHMKRTAPAEYQKFIELAVNASESLSGEEKTTLINEYKTVYSEGTESTFTDTQAIDELVADFTKNIVKDIKAFKNLINADKNVAQRFLEGVKSFITKVKATFSGDKSKMDTAAKEKYGASIEELEAAVSSWEKMFAETEAGVKDGKLHNLSMNEAVEETNDLIAVHNASEDQIIEALRRGQFFMPSVAVTNKGLLGFGDMSVIFNRSTIDPEADGDNRLYGSDAWTPIQTELKKNPKFDEGAVEEVLYGIRETIGEGAEQLFADDAESFKQKVTDADGSLYNAYSKDMGMQAAYAIEKGLISGIPTDGSGNVDIEKLQAELDAVMDADSEWRAYKKWLSGLSSEVITAYDRASDEDIMRTMEAQPDYAKRFKLSESGELTAPVVPYSSIEDFRRNKGRLSDTAEEDAKALGAEMLELAGKISKNSGMDLSQAVEAINNAFAHRYSQENIVQSFKDSGARISRKNADILQGLYRRAVELSTPYFEAKPHRSVGTDEIAAVVVPDNTSAELKEKLSEAGIRVVEYEAGNEADRLAKMNSLDDVKFSKKNTAGDESGGVQYDLKRKQFEIIEKNNPAPNTYQTWIRSEGDVLTLEEAVEDSDWDYDEYNPDYTRKMAKDAIKKGEIRVYSSYPIDQGVFVTPSKMEAESYSGTGEVYSKVVPISDIAWIDPTQGQYAAVDSEGVEKTAEKEYNSDNKTKGVNRDEKTGESYNRGNTQTAETDENRRPGKVSERIGRVLGTDGAEQSLQRRSRVKRIAVERKLIPKKGSVAESSQKEAEQYGIKAYVVSDADWEECNITAPAFVSKGIIYMRETIPEEHRGAIIPHERIHIMKQKKYAPYLNFLKKTPNLLNIGSKEYMYLLNQASVHIGEDLFEISEERLDDLYDEINCIVFGGLKAKNISINMDVLGKAFKNFDAWYNELSQMLSEFSQQTKQNNNEEAVDASDASAASSAYPGKSNREFSLKGNTDNMGRELSAEQAEYFKDSKVRDKDGNLITVYHGTQRGGFTVFNRTYNWYTDNSEMAQSYTQSPDVYEGYLNIKKPYIIDAKGDKWSGIAIDEETKELLDQYGSSTFKENGEWRTSTADIVSAVFDAIEEGEADYDGVIILNVNDFGSYYKGDISGIGNDYISFKSSQFKNIENKTPTENPDIRYSLKTEDLLSPEYWEKKRTSDGDGAPGTARPTEVAGAVKDASDATDDDWFDEYVDQVNKQEQVLREEHDPEKEMLAGYEAEKKTLGKKVKDSADWAQRKIINSGNTVRKIANKTKDEALYPLYNKARSATNAAAYMIEHKQTNIRGEEVGDSLVDIIAPIKEKGKEYWEDFNMYMFHKHNIARMSLQDDAKVERIQKELLQFNKDHPGVAIKEEHEIKEIAKREDDRGLRARQYLEIQKNLRAAREKNKPIFIINGLATTAERSRTKAKELLKKHPDFAEHEKDLRKYLDNLMQYRVDTGLVTEREAEYFKKKYPDYVPAYRILEDDAISTKKKGETAVGKTVKKATGGKEKIEYLDKALVKMTRQVVRNGQKNLFARRLNEDFLKNNTLKGRYAPAGGMAEYDVDEEIEGTAEAEKATNKVMFYDNGQKVELTVTPDLFEAFETLSKEPNEDNMVLRGFEKYMEMKKKLITTYDPTFVIVNAIKDIQDAFFNTRDMKGFAKNLPKAYAQILSNGKMWKLYQAAGGLHSSELQEMQDKGIKKKDGVAKKVAGALPYANMLVEQATRLAEFMSVAEKGNIKDPNVLADALLASAEITTNFGESGTIGKVLNKYMIPFLNPAIQGTAQFFRTLKRSRTGKEWIGFITRGAVMGLTVGFINDLLNGDDEDYENLDERTKDNYYLFGLGDGEFAKIPKGRVTAALGIISDRVRDVMKGEDVDAGQALAMIFENIFPENPLENTIFSPISDIVLLSSDDPGRTWYGGNIESERLQALPVEERYDSDTDYLSRILGKALGISPKKINYALKQELGGLGKMGLPAITPSTQKGDNIPEMAWEGFKGIWTSRFTVDSKTQNKVNGEFYDAVTEAEQTKNSSKGTLADKVVYKHLNRERNQMSSYNSKIKKAEDDGNLTGKERQAAVRTASAERTAYQKEILQNLPKYRKAVDKYLKEYPGTDEEKKTEYAYRKANYDIYGAEYAIRVNGGADVHKKALEKVNRGKTTWDEYYDSYFGRDERRYEVISKKYGLSYEQFERIAEAMSKGKGKEEEIKEIQKVLGCKYNKAMYIRSNYENTK